MTVCGPNMINLVTSNTKALALVKFILSINDEELMLHHFLVQEQAQFLRRHLDTLLHEHLKHRVDTIQGQGVQVGEHAQDVRPEYLSLVRGVGVSRYGGGCGRQGRRWGGLVMDL